MKIWTFAIIVVALSGMLLGSSLYKADLENGEIRDIYNFTENTVTYKSNYSFNELTENISQVDLPKIKYFRLARVVDSFTNFILITSFEAIKFFIEYGYDNPDINYKLYYNLLIVILILSFWSALVPIIAILVLIYKGIKYLWKKLKRANLPENLQWLTVEENMKKGGRF